MDNGSVNIHERHGNNAWIYSTTTMSEPTTTVFEPDEIKTDKFKVMPRKMTKVKEWSISARALKNVLTYLMATGQTRCDYKFVSVYDNRHKIYRVWNVMTRNVIATVKLRESDTVIRYRPNSHYAGVIRSIGDGDWARVATRVVESSNLHINRGRSSHALRYASGDLSAQIGFRNARLREALINKERTPQ